MPKKRINLTLDDDLVSYARFYAREQRSTVSELINQFLLNLKRTREGDPTSFILSDPEFEKILMDAIKRIRAGKMKWHTYEEVFK